MRKSLLVQTTWSPALMPPAPTGEWPPGVGTEGRWPRTPEAGPLSCLQSSCYLICF